MTAREKVQAQRQARQASARRLKVSLTADRFMFAARYGSAHRGVK